MNPYSINPVAATRRASDPDQKDPKNNPISENPLGKETNADPKNAIGPNGKQLGTDELIKEISWSETDVLQSYLPFANNPDPIVRSKGLKIYREMMQDDQVKVCIDVRIQARLSTPWEIVPGLPGNAQAEEMAAFIKECLMRMRGNFETDMEQIYSAIGYGFSISEKVFDYIETGKFKGKIGLRAIKTREPYNYDFKVDSHGNMLGLTYIGMTGKDNDDPQLMGTLNSLAALIPSSQKQGANSPLGTIQNPFPPEKFIIYPYNPQFGNWYGRSDLMAAFKWWLMKKHGSKFWAIWLERYASPFVWAQYKRDAGLKKEALLAIDDFIRNLSARQGVRVSDAVDLNTIQFAPAAGDAYEKAIEAYNRYIAHAILFPNLMGFTGAQGSSGGSYSLGQKQMESFIWILNKMGRDMSETVVGDQIIKQLIQINFGDVDNELMPKFKFISIDDASIETRSKIIETLTRAGLVAREEEWVRDFLTIPKKAPDIILPETQQPGGFGGGQGSGWNKGGDGSKPQAKENVPAQDKKSDAKDTEVKKMKEVDPNFFEKKMKVDHFKTKLDFLDKNLFEEASVAITGIRDDVISQVERKKLIVDGNPKDVQKLAVNTKELRDVFAKWIVKIFLDAKLGQLEELARGGVDVEIVKKFTVSNDWDPLPPQEAIDYFKRKVTARLVDDTGRRVIIDITSGVDISFFQQRAFMIAGIVRDDILNDAKQILLNGIKRQDQVGAVKDLKDMFNKYLDQGTEVDEELLAPHRLNTIVRTNITEAINEGRAEMMTHPDVGEFVQFFQYTAIMDERTTDYCRCMDGKIFRIEDILLIKPPAHYNCRSFTVPVTQFEIDDLKEQGRGVEVSEACAGRMAGFSDLKRDALSLPIPARVAPNPAFDAPAAPRSPADQAANQRLRQELRQIIARCPYKACGSESVRMIGHKYNMGEFTCETCSMPFRVSNSGDLYLYEAGLDKWERVSGSLMPQYFSEYSDKIKNLQKV